jgi:chemotaxis protein CheD
MIGERKVVGVAQSRVGGAGDVLVALGLGSCVAVVLHDPRASIGGLAHVLLPHPNPRDDPEGSPARFATTAVPHLVEEMKEMGAYRHRMVARLVGGAAMFGKALTSGGMGMGTRNVDAARRALARLSIPIIAQATGDEHGRSVYFDPASGELYVTAADREGVFL